MKTYIKKISFSVSVLFLAGCSFASNSSDGGVFRSDDGGKSFAQKVTIDEKTLINSVDVLSLVANPQNGNEVYIGTVSNGVLKTIDAGEKWQVIKVSPNAAAKVYTVAIDPINSNVVYVAAVVDGRGKILKSTDAGATWKEIYSESSSGPFVLALAIDPAGSGKIFGGTTEGQIIFSDNSGDSWKNLYKAQGGVFKIAIDSMNPGLAYFAVSQSGLLRTRDGGKNFENLGEKNTSGGQQQFGSPTAITTDPNKANWIYAGTTKGLFRSKNGGDDWEAMKVLSDPQENAIRGIAINPINSDEVIYGAAQAFYKSVDGGQSWATTQFNGSRTIETIAYDRQNPGIIYAGMNKR
ncbi:MAG: YCF48-related protein [Candidatus Moranbacteria bacterium]|nr:YCF48-related protein [Candidatus Moranbacteria bacterium]